MEEAFTKHRVGAALYQFFLPQTLGYWGITQQWQGWWLQNECLAMAEVTQDAPRVLPENCRWKNTQAPFSSLSHPTDLRT